MPSSARFQQAGGTSTSLLCSDEYQVEADTKLGDMAQPLLHDHNEGTKSQHIVDQADAGASEDIESVNRDTVDIETVTFYDIDDESYFYTLDPPPSKSELFRDCILDCLETRVKRIISSVALFLVIVDGAFMFFLMAGWHNMCEPKLDCEPRNFWVNMSIQILNVLFTYLVTISLPWRMTMICRLYGDSCGREPIRPLSVGLDLYGRPTELIWFHIPISRLKIIILLLIANTLTQYANQVTRIVYYSYDLSNNAPGNIWVNVFFAASISCSVLAGIVQIHAENVLRKANPEKFPADLVTLYSTAFYENYVVFTEWMSEKCGSLPTAKKKVPKMPDVGSYWTRFKKWFRNDRPSLAAWGL
mmetsp:Transcript_16922/g.24826  ORF Transcript_16922/g.24826 Transcript_16922/m.24826 type:complete len:359 (-) Transcript_16922:177-1253(-)